MDVRDGLRRTIDWFCELTLTPESVVVPQRSQVPLLASGVTGS